MNPKRLLFFYLFTFFYKPFLVPEGKEVLKKNRQRWGYVKGTQEVAERASSSERWNNLTIKIKYYWSIIQTIK